MQSSSQIAIINKTTPSFLQAGCPSNHITQTFLPKARLGPSNLVFDQNEVTNISAGNTTNGMAVKTRKSF